MAEPTQTLNELVELLQENGYSVANINNFETHRPDRFTVEFDIENLNYE